MNDWEKRRQWTWRDELSELIFSVPFAIIVLFISGFAFVIGK